MSELLRGYLYLILYIIIVLPGILFLRRKAKLPNELFRKMLHCVLLGIIPLWLYVYTHWWIGVIACAAIVIVAYPLLALASKVSWCADFLIERKPGEFRSSLVIVFVMFAIVIAVCWGIYDDKLLAFASVYAWGPGDAAAALVGTRFGRHKIQIEPIAGKKSYEGTIAMFVTSFLCTWGILLVRGGMKGWSYVVTALFVAFASAVIELFSKNGNDTITCPVGAMITLILMLNLLGGM